MKKRWITAQTWYWITAGLVFGGIVHICTVFMLPYLSSNSAWERLSGELQVNQFRVLPLARPGFQPIPLMAPDVRYALCRYDAANGPVMVRASLLDTSWSVSLYDRLGINFYTITGADLRHSDVELQLQRKQRTENLFAKDKDSQIGSAIAIDVPDIQGLVILRAPLRGTSYSAETEIAISQAGCRQTRTAAQ